jgi:hypothetical protein
MIKMEKKKRRKQGEEMERKKKAALKKIRTQWKLQKRIEEQSRASLLKLQSKWNHFHVRLVNAKKIMGQCEKYLSGEVVANVDNPLQFIKEDELAGNLSIPT